MGPLLFLIGLAIAGAAIFAFFRPLPKLRMATRQSAVVGLLLGLASCVTGLSLPEPSKSPASAPAISQDQSAGADKAALQAEADQLWSSVKSGLASCDALVTQAGEAMTGAGNGRGDIYTAYDAATKAEKACANASLEMNALEVPKHARGEAKKAFKEALQGCVFVATSKQIAMRSTSEVLNGDASPKAVSQAREDMQSAGAFSTKCVIDFMSAAEKGGVVLADFKPKSATTTR